MRGIPSVNTCKMSAGFTNEPRKRPRQLVKREGGAKLIDIDEIPQALKIRRREQAAEEKAKKLQEKEEKKRLQAEKADAEKVYFLYFNYLHLFIFIYICIYLQIK